MNNWSDFTESYMGFELMPMLDDDGLEIMEEMIEFIGEQE